MGEQPPGGPSWWQAPDAGRREERAEQAPEAAEPQPEPQPEPTPEPQGWGSPAGDAAPARTDDTAPVPTDDTAPVRTDDTAPLGEPGPTPAMPEGHTPAGAVPPAAAYAAYAADPPPGPLAGHQGSDFPPGPDGPAPARRRGRGPRVVLAVLAVGALLLASLAAGYAGALVADRRGGGSAPAPTFGTAEPGSLERPADTVAGVAAAVLPSVVSIEVAFSGGQGSGSGFVIGDDGFVLTNNHVVANAVEGGDIVVVFSDGTQEPAEIVGRTTGYDLAVLKVDRTGLPALEFADSDSVVVGDPVVAVGAPLGLESTVTSGIVSALNRPVSAGNGNESAFINAIQTDAAINPGNSGGPLVDMTGKVIGVNSAIARAPGSGPQGTGSIGLGFAIPSNQAVRTAQEIVETGSASYPVIGVLLDTAYRGEGVKVVEEPQEGRDVITPGGPAERAGIQPGDLIVAFEGRPVTEPDALIVAIRAQRPGDTVTLTIRRDGRDRDLELVLDEAESDE